jgi:hypothetical protein
LETLAPTRPQDDVQVRTHVGKVVNPHFEPARHATQHVAHGALVLAQGQRSSGSLARENHMHGPSRAHRALELALAAANVAAVLRSRQLCPHWTIEYRQLHRDAKGNHDRPRGNVVARKIAAKMKEESRDFDQRVEVKFFR